MSLLLDHPNNIINNSFNISGSKSESNRLLILKYLLKNIEIRNLSDSDDTISLQNALNSPSGSVDIHHAGTAMRFLTAYFSIQVNKNYEIFGSRRMHERPIEILVDALNDLGADIKYLSKKGFPPLKINGKELDRDQVYLDANISSQYITALILIAPVMKNGLVINLVGNITSRPYIEMSLSILKRIGIQTSFINNKIKIKPFKNEKKIVQTVESDWSSLSYFYSIVTLSKEANLKISSFLSNSLQGDKELVSIYKKLGVQTIFDNGNVKLKKNQKVNLPKKIVLTLNDTPDLAQTIAVTCFGLGLPCDLFGLQTLKIKETDRLLALKTELEKLGANVEITNESLHLKKRKKFNSNIEINTYDDHRMAMAFAPLAIIKPIIINDSKVISKSFPSFWNILSELNFRISEY